MPCSTGIFAYLHHATHNIPRKIRARVNGLITRVPDPDHYRLTADGLRIAIFYSKGHQRLLRPLLAADQPPAPPPIRKGLHTTDIHISETLDRVHLLPKAASKLKTTRSGLATEVL